jgi:hypothetical protein
VPKENRLFGKIVWVGDGLRTMLRSRMIGAMRDIELYRALLGLTAPCTAEPRETFQAPGLPEHLAVIRKNGARRFTPRAARLQLSVRLDAPDLEVGWRLRVVQRSVHGIRGLFAAADGQRTLRRELTSDALPMLVARPFHAL